MAMAAGPESLGSRATSTSSSSDSVISSSHSLEKSNTEKINLLRQIEELKAKNESLKQIEVNLAQKYAVSKKELEEYYEKEVNQFKAQNEELRKQVASTESLNVALDKKNKELVQEFINTVNKANEQKDKIKIEYDKLLKAIEERDNYITLHKTQYKNLNN